MNQSTNQNPNAPQAPAPGTPAAPVVTAADMPFLMKARYFGTGLVVGVFVSPLVRNAVSKFAPGLNSMMENLQGQAEEMVEKSAGGLVVKAKGALKREAKENSHAHSGACSH